MLENQNSDPKIQPFFLWPSMAVAFCTWWQGELLHCTRERKFKYFLPLSVPVPLPCMCKRFQMPWWKCSILKSCLVCKNDLFSQEQATVCPSTFKETGWKRCVPNGSQQTFFAWSQEPNLQQHIHLRGLMFLFQILWSAVFHRTKISIFWKPGNKAFKYCFKMQYIV